MKGPFKLIQWVPFGALSVGGSWHVEVSFRFVPG